MRPADRLGRPRQARLPHGDRAHQGRLGRPSARRQGKSRQGDIFGPRNRQGEHRGQDPERQGAEKRRRRLRRGDRKSVVEGKSVSVRVDLGGRSIIKKTTKSLQKPSSGNKPQRQYTSKSRNNER